MSDPTYGGDPVLMEDDPEGRRVPDPEPEPEEMDLCSCEQNMKVVDEPWCPSCTEQHEGMIAYANSIIAKRRHDLPILTGRVFCSGCNNRHEPDVCPFRY